MTLRADRILALADRIEEDAGKLWDMRHTGNPRCGTPGCMIGHAQAMMIEEGKILIFDGEVRANGTVGAWLGIPNLGVQAHLFTPNFGSACYWAGAEHPSFISHQRAAAQLRRLAATGGVDWEATP